jgi:hypothetical protein
MRGLRHIGALAAVVLGMVMVTGCKTAEPGVKNYAGTVCGVVHATPERVTAAARETLEELKLNSIFSEATRIDGKVMARTARDKTVDIEITTAPEESSKVQIRVAEFGDEELSLQILNRIRSKVK